MRTDAKDQARVKALVAAAAAKAGGQNELARATGYSKTNVSEWANGTRPCPPKAQAVMAHLAGLDSVEVLVMATIAQEESTERKGVLLRALGKRFAHLGAAALFGISAVFGLAPKTAQASFSANTMRRKVKFV